MDILSFIMGLKKGKNSVKLQEKSVTPGASEIVVEPDVTYDALSKVIVGAVQGGGTPVCTRGKFTASGKNYILKHGLGTTPMMFWVHMTYGLNETTAKTWELAFAAGINQTAADAGGIVENMQYLRAWNEGFDSEIQTTPDEPIDSTNYELPLHDANDTTITIGSTGSYCPFLQSGTEYSWLAVGLLESK